MQTTEPRRGARPKPVPPALTHEQREVGRLKALRTTAERKEIRARLRSGEVTLAQALERDDEAAGRMRAETLLRALPGIGAATAARLMTQAGIDAARRAGALTAGQRTRLLAAVVAVNAELGLVATGVIIQASDRDAPRSPRRGREALPAALAGP